MVFTVQRAEQESDSRVIILCLNDSVNDRVNSFTSDLRVEGLHEKKSSRSLNSIWSPETVVKSKNIVELYSIIATHETSINDIVN